MLGDEEASGLKGKARESWVDEVIREKPKASLPQVGNHIPQWVFSKGRWVNHCHKHFWQQPIEDQAVHGPTRV